MSASTSLRAVSGTEIEFKAGLTAADASFVGRMLGRQHGPALSQAQLRTLYHDTPDFALKAHGIALRVRREGGKSVQTVKDGRAVVGGFQQVREVDCSIRGLKPKIDAIPDRTLRNRIATLTDRKPLLLVFETRVRRGIWRIAEPHALVEVALDRGSILAGARTAPILEIEFELLGGTPAALFDLAARLLSGTSAWPSISSKAARGHALASGKSVEPAAQGSKPAPPERGTSSAEAFGAAFAALAPAIAQNLHLIHVSDDPEGPHQLRVSLRRLRALVKLHGRHLDRATARRINAEARSLGRIVSPLRDTDVLVADLVAHAPGLAAPLEEHRAAMRAETRVALRRAGATGMAIWLLRLAALGGWQPHGKQRRKRGLKPLENQAAPILDEAWDAIAEACDRLSALLPEDRHELRKRMKTFRYMLEQVPRGDGQKSFLSALKRLQDDLGELNDLATLEGWSPDLDTPGALQAFAALKAKRLSGSRHRQDLLMGRAFRHWQELKSRPHPWNQTRNQTRNQA